MMGFLFSVSVTIWIIVYFMKKPTNKLVILYVVY
jgi:hypothetical protein